MDNREPPDEEEAFSEMLVSAEDRRARQTVIDPKKTYVSLGVAFLLVMGLLGALRWLDFSMGVLRDSNRDLTVRLNQADAALTQASAALTSKLNQAAAERTIMQGDIAALRRRVLYVKEMDLWAQALLYQNSSKFVVPKPSDFKVETWEPDHTRRNED